MAVTSATYRLDVDGGRSGVVGRDRERLERAIRRWGLGVRILRRLVSAIPLPMLRAEEPMGYRQAALPALELQSRMVTAATSTWPLPPSIDNLDKPISMDHTVKPTSLDHATKPKVSTRISNDYACTRKHNQDANILSHMK